MISLIYVTCMFTDEEIKPVLEFFAPLCNYVVVIESVRGKENLREGKISPANVEKLRESWEI